MSYKTKDRLFLKAKRTLSFLKVKEKNTSVKHGNTLIKHFHYFSTGLQTGQTQQVNLDLFLLFTGHLTLISPKVTALYDRL